MEEKKLNSKKKRGFLDRDIPFSFIEENTEKYSKPAANEVVKPEKFFVFKIGGKLYGLKVNYFFESFDNIFVHSVPFRTNDFLLGLANVRGELELLLNILSLPDFERIDDSDGNMRQRYLFLGNGELRFLMQVCEAYGVVDVEESELELLPGNIAGQKDSMFKKRFVYEKSKVLIIDEDVFFRKIDEKLEL